MGTRVGVVAAASDVIRLLAGKTSVSCACAPARLRSRKITAAAVSLTPSTPSAGAQERRWRRRARATSTLHSPAPSREIAPQQSRPSSSRCVGGKRVTIGCCPLRPQFHGPVQEIYDIGFNFVVTPNRQVCVTELAPRCVSPVPCRLRVHARMHGRNHTHTHTHKHTHTGVQQRNKASLESGT